MQNPWLWPFDAALRVGATALLSYEDFLGAALAGLDRPEPAWTTPKRTVLDLPALRVHELGGGSGPPVVLLAPFALHGPVLADLAPGHSLVERLLAEEVGPLFLVECRSATRDTRMLGIDDYLASLLVAVEELGEPATLVGLCQGGWLALMFAARFPRRVSRLLLAGAPVDLDAAESRIVAAARGTPPEAVRALVESGDGLVCGRRMRGPWGSHGLERDAVADVLQTEPSPDLLARFQAWHAWTIDLPGPFYVQVVEDLFRANKLAKGEFLALGRTLDLTDVRAPICLVASDGDEVTPPEQVFAARRLVGTAPEQVRTVRAAGAHLSLFMGARNLRTVWSDAARWLRGPAPGREAARRTGAAIPPARGAPPAAVLAASGRASLTVSRAAGEPGRPA